VVLDINDEWASAERRYFSEASMADLYPPRDDEDATPGELVPAERSPPGMTASIPTTSWDVPPTVGWLLGRSGS
jgi:hypothetical protein